MKKLNHIQKKAGRLVKRHELIAGAAIFVFILLHFISPFIFIRNENHSNEITSLKTENKQSVSIEAEYKKEYKTEYKKEYKAKSAEIGKTPVLVSPAAQTKPKIVPPRTVIKKKEPPRESRAERLRRAERILTGV